VSLYLKDIVEIVHAIQYWDCSWAW